jgi:hypothetical protein
VGAPGYKTLINGGVTAVGRVSAYAIPHAGSCAAALAACLKAFGAPASPAPLFTVTADTSLLLGATISAKLGHGVAAGFPRGAGAGAALALGMTAVDLCNSTALGNGTDAFASAAGSVTLLQVAPALRGDLAWSQLAGALAPALNATVLGSGLADSRFGWRLQFADLDGDGLDDLLVGAPMRTPFFLGAAAGGAGAGAVARNDSGHEAGSLFAFRGGAALPFAGAPVGAPGAHTCASADRAWMAFSGQAEFGRFGSAALLASARAGAPPVLLVSAPRVTEVVPPQELNAAARNLQDDPSASLEMPGAVYAFATTTR